MRRTVTVSIGWLALALLLIVVGVLLLVTRRSAAIDPARVRAVCEQYAGLDLSGLAPLCIDAGYAGRRVYLQPTDPADWWPVVQRVVHPEDIDR